MAWIGGFGLIVLTETKIKDKAYFRQNMGYDMVWLEAHMMESGEAQGVVDMIVRNQLQGWSIEETHFCGEIVMNCKFMDKNGPRSS